MEQSFKKAELMSLINIGKQPDLSEAELLAIMGHRKGPQTHLLQENLIIHGHYANTKIIITKTLVEDMDIAEYVGNVMNCCSFKFWISLGIGKI